MLQTRNLLILAAALSVTQGAAEEKPSAAAKLTAEQSLKERFENLGLIYKDKKNPGLQELWVLGRYHGHYHDNDGSHGQDSGFESRRVSGYTCSPNPFVGSVENDVNSFVAALLLYEIP